MQRKVSLDLLSGSHIGNCSSGPFDRTWMLAFGWQIAGRSCHGLIE
jgi:hypothetical protein